MKPIAHSLQPVSVHGPRSTVYGPLQPTASGPQSTVYSLRSAFVHGLCSTVRFRLQSVASVLFCPRSTVYGLRSASGGLQPLIYRPQSTAYGLRPASSGLRPSASILQPTAYSLQSGFTLVELMVVVAIIAILLMLLIPNIRTMREKALSAHCQNNLRQYGIAMNQYMADYNGYFIYPGAGGQDAGRGYDESTKGKGGIYSFVAPSGGQAGSAVDYWDIMIPAYIPAEVTIQSLAAGNPSVRVCPTVLQQIKKDGNFFDPDSPNFKGLQDSTDWAGQDVQLADFEIVSSRGSDGYDVNGKLILDPAFTTYAINPQKLYRNKKYIPENVVAFIDWNARDGWWATLGYTNWMFNGTNSQGVVVAQNTPKRIDGAWWLSEVGFYHLGSGNAYGANYVAMDGHVGWISSNTISSTNFTGL